MQSTVAKYLAAAMLFFASLVNYFPATLDCSDYIQDIHYYNKTYFKPCIKFLVEKKSNNLFLGCSAGWISNFPPNFEHFPIV